MGIIVRGSSNSFISLGTMEGRRSTGQALIGVGVNLAATGQLDEALEVFQRAQTTLSVGVATRGTSEDDHVDDLATDHKPGTIGVSADVTSSEDDISSNVTSDHVPKPTPSSSSCKRLRRAHGLARRDRMSTCTAGKKRRTDSATASEASSTKGHGGLSSPSSPSSPSRQMPAMSGGKGNSNESTKKRAAEEIAQAEMYREEASEDLGTQNFSEALRIEHQEGAIPKCALSSPTALYSSSITCDAAIAAYNVAVTYDQIGDSEELALLSYRRCLFLLHKTNADATNATISRSSSLLSSMALNNIAHILYKKEKMQDSERHLMSAMRGTPEVFDLSDGAASSTNGVQMDLAELIMASTLASLAGGGDVSSTNSPDANASRLHVQAIVLSNLGRFLFRFSRLTEALAVCLTLSTIRKRLLGHSSHMAIAVIEYNIGLIKHKMGSSVEAKTHYENFLATATLPIETGGVGKGPEGRIIIAFARHQIGLLLSIFGQKDEAMRTLSEVLALRKSVYGNDHSEISKTLFSIAQIQFERGLHNQSLSTFNQVILMARKVLPPNHMIFVFSLSYVAQIYRARGHTAEAIIIYEKCYAVAIKAFGHNHYVVINIVNSMAQLRLSRGEYGQAAAAFGRASGLVVQTIVNSSCLNQGSVITRCKKKVAKCA